MRLFVVVIAKAHNQKPARHHINFMVKASTKQAARAAAVVKFPRSEGFRVGQVSEV